MTKTRFLLSLSLLPILLAACAPASTATAPPAVVTEAPTLALPTATAAPTLETPAEEIATTEAAEPTSLPIATSRGPDLHATDPTTVSLASGGLQFVEFFRFT